MRSRTVTATLTAIGLVAAAAAMHHVAQAQQDVAPAPRMFGGGMPFGGPAQLAVSGNHLFILRGNTVYRLNTSSLAVESQAELPGPQPAGAGAPVPPPPATAPETPAPTPPAPEAPAPEPPAPGNGTPPSSP